MRSTRTLFFAAAAIASCTLVSGPADAGGLGKFVSGLVARGVVRGVVSGAARSTPGNTYASGFSDKTYTPNVLTVDQLVQCLKTASALDQQSEVLEGKRSELQLAGREIDQLRAQLEMNPAAVIRSSQVSVDRFNAEVDRYNAIANRLKSKEADFNGLVSDHNSNVTGFNAACAKQYYADDMESARKLAGI
jgi:hypothetical protein